MACSLICSAFALAAVSLIASTGPEAFGRTAIEAQMMGSPVIATRIGAPPETVRAPPEVAAEARTGWLIAPGDPAALATALTEALGLGPEVLAGLSARAIANARDHFSLAAMKAATLAVYLL